MKELNLKEEEIQILLGELGIDIYDETITNSELASRNKRHTYYECKRTYKYKGKEYIAEWSCNSYFDGKETYNTEEYCNRLFEL